MFTPKERQYLKGDVWKSPKLLAQLSGPRAEFDWAGGSRMPRFVVDCHKRCEREGRASRYVYRADTLADAYFDAGGVITAGVDL